MPRGLTNYRETTLLDSEHFLPADKRQELKYWWLRKPRGANVPDWDIASNCTLEGRKRLLLVEAKAHDKELSEAGKSAWNRRREVSGTPVWFLIRSARLRLEFVG